MSDQNEVWLNIDESERDRVLQEATKSHQTMTLLSAHSSFEVQMETFENSSLHFHFEKTRPIPFRPGEKISARWDAKGETYRFAASPRFEVGGGFISVPLEVFKKQRRSVFRMTVPENFPAFFDFTRPANLVPARIIDINEDGLSLEILNSGLKNGDFFRGFITLGQRPGLEIEASVRFSSGSKIGAVFEFGRLDASVSMMDLLSYFRVDVFNHKKKS